MLILGGRNGFIMVYIITCLTSTLDWLSLWTLHPPNQNCHSQARKVLQEMDLYINMASHGVGAARSVNPLIFYRYLPSLRPSWLRGRHGLLVGHLPLRTGGEQVGWPSSFQVVEAFRPRSRCFKIDVFVLECTGQVACMCRMPDIWKTNKKPARNPVPD